MDDKKKINSIDKKQGNKEEEMNQNLIHIT